MVVSIYEVRAERRTLLRLMERKFGAVPEEVRVRLEAISDIEVLDRLLDAVLTAVSVKEMGI